jgi:hypothetical protein
MQTSSPRRVVYTALFGDYEQLVEQPVSCNEGIDFICFSDRPRVSRSWHVIVVELPVPTDAARSARHIKILGHPALAEFDEWLWIDNRVVLTAPPSVIFDEWLCGFDLAIPFHDHRETVDAEFAAVLRAGFDSSYRVREELHTLRRDMPHVLDEAPLWTGLLARRPTASVQQLAQTWIAMVLLYSRRDQLSINFAVASSSVNVHRIDLANRASRLHTWLTVEELPKNSTTRFSPSSGFRYRPKEYLADTFLQSRLGLALRSIRRAVRERSR